MSLQELRARIEEISIEIELQKKLLKKLEHDKRVFQRQLNAVQDPVARLPLEISSEIFLQSLDPFPQPGAHRTPMLLLNICNAWTNIALSTPSLWAAIDVVFPRARRFEELLEIWLRRARNHPLSVSLSGDFDGHGAFAVFRIVWRHGHQMKHLEIWQCDDNDDFDDDNELVNLFGGTIPRPLPQLETLTIRGSRRGFDGPQILELLHLVPNLLECNFHNVQPVYNVKAKPEKLVLPKLRRLMFGPHTDYGHPDSDDDVLECLSLPGLQVLLVPLHYVGGGELLSFLERSSPPLQELVVGQGSELTGSNGLHDYFRLVPILTCFEVWRPDFALITELFAALDSSSTLPNLHILTIRNLSESDSAIPDSSWKTLLRALYARRPQFQTLRIEMEGDPPPVDIIAAMRELVDGGMQIHIGTEWDNFIVT
ncbi:hypothetical protein MVEN_02503600 [Mycena venus]|uniref:F-box domain-containing protein n=1 Tax=Mycena venus TaxID=2733690 RepID=A0A8H6WUG6_9AGAR|nr:hypothetical protein MVEN_02503600 [Mycena venus]